MSTTPPPYDRQATFTSFSTEPAPTVGQDLEAEFNKVKQSLDATQSRLTEIQRDDGRLKNDSVHPDALSQAVRAILAYSDGAIRGAWITGAVYNVRDVIEGPDGITYVASVQHVANASFSVDLNAGRWLTIDSGQALDALLRSDLANATTGAAMSGYTPASTGTPGTVKSFLDAFWTAAATSLIRYTSPSTGVLGTLKDFLDSLWTSGANTGAALIRFLQVGASGVARTVQDKLYEHTSVTDFMSAAQRADIKLANPVLDHTAAIQAAATACATGGADACLYFPKGKYNISSEINVQFSGTVYGAGKQDTIIRKTVAGINHFTTVGSFGQVEFCDFGLETTVVANAGAGILVNTTNPSDGAQSGTRISNVRTLNLYDGFRVLNGAYFVFDRNILIGTINNSIYADCTSNYDAGDNSICHNVIIGGGTTGAGIYLVNNCRVIDNKILNHGKGIVVGPNAVAGTRVDYQIIGNSIENFATHGIHVSVTNAGTGAANSIIGQNQLAAFINSSQCIAINGPAGGWSINNNIAVLIGTSTVGIAMVGNGIGAPGTIIVNDNIVSGGPASSIGIYSGGSGIIVSGNLVASAAQRYEIASSGVTIRNTDLTFAEMTGFATAAANGSVVYCSNGTVASPVADGGTGCIAKRLNGVWVGN